MMGRSVVGFLLLCSTQFAFGKTPTQDVQMSGLSCIRDGVEYEKGTKKVWETVYNANDGKKDCAICRGGLTDCQYCRGGLTDANGVCTGEYIKMSGWDPEIAKGKNRGDPGHDDQYLPAQGAKQCRKVPVMHPQTGKQLEREYCKGMGDSCFHESTKFITRTGPKAASLLKVGDEVQCVPCLSPRSHSPYDRLRLQTLASCCELLCVCVCVCVFSC